MKRSSDFFRKIKKLVLDLVNNNFAEVMKIILVIGGVVIAITLILSFMISGGVKKVDTTAIESIKEDFGIESEIDFLTNNELLFPQNSVFDLSLDYIDLMSIKEFKLPKIDIIIQDYENILKDSIEEDLKFNFEKRGGK
ncbi:MAG TPA: hypothetical protein PK385_05335 [Spirochaetota bacterium]|nr:hypothetical protein [Spirochaetota bacterium]HOS32119.1 hypothetical protein [Spirochaetota bacterium]HOS55460.1 hypothetical protein [Spirochaetota bacterium]HPK62231.1 hypothetical protein [Spirochaetota bacterium]HQF77980.1 hypothetical protein [Spirochaetota bacterium]